MAEKLSSAERLEKQFGYKQELRRGLGLWDVVLYGVLFMVIIAPHSIWGLVQTQGLGMSTLVYLVGFVAIAFTALSYVSMSRKFPIAGSVYSYVQRGLNPHAGFISGWMILLDYCITPALLYTMVANWGTMLVPNSPWWLWVIVFVILRDAYLLGGGAYLLFRWKQRVPVIYLGKVATTFLFVGFAGLLLNFPQIPGAAVCDISWLPGFNAQPVSWGIWFVYAGLVLATITTVIYTFKGWRALKRGQALEAAHN